MVVSPDTVPQVVYSEYLSHNLFQLSCVSPVIEISVFMLLLLTVFIFFKLLQWSSSSSLASLFSCFLSACHVKISIRTITTQTERHCKCKNPHLLLMHLCFPTSGKTIPFAEILSGQNWVPERTSCEYHHSILLLPNMISDFKKQISSCF